MVRNDKGLKYTMRDDLWDDKDRSIMDVRYGEKRVRIINVYNQAKQGGKGIGWCMERFPKGVCKGQPTILIGDFNAKGGQWDQKEEEPRGRLVTEVTEGEDLELLNKIGRPTWKQKGKRAAVLDLAWASSASRHLASWKIME